jgi:hypothetical protein
MNKPVKNLSASVHQELLNRSHETNQPFNELTQYYGIEQAFALAILPSIYEEYDTVPITVDEYE